MDIAADSATSARHRFRIAYGSLTLRARWAVLAPGRQRRSAAGASSPASTLSTSIGDIPPAEYEAAYYSATITPKAA
jgi:hypothetical protein